MVGRVVPLALLIAALFGFGSAVSLASAEGEITGSVPTGGGVGLVQWGGGTPAAVASVVGAKGCALQSLWVASGGRLDGYVAGAPDFVNAAFSARFTGGVIPMQTPLVLVCAAGITAPPTSAPKPPVVAPPGVTVSGAEWISVAAPDGKTILAAVFRPSGTAPAPVVVVLHGTAGFSNNFLQTAKDLAASGYVAVAGCWFGGHFDGSARVEQPSTITLPDGIDCPNAPTFRATGSTDFVVDVNALLAAARALPGVRSDRLAVMGHSRGSVAALTVAALSGGVQAVVASAGTIPAPGGTLIAIGMSAPVLLLQGEADTVVPASDTRAQEAALRGFGKPVQATYYAGAGHGYLFETQWHTTALLRIRQFLDETLR